MGGPARKKPRMEEVPPPKAQGRSDDEKGATSSILDDSLCAMEEKGAAGEEAVACPFTESCASDEENELLAEGEKAYRSRVEKVSAAQLYRLHRSEETILC
ncbi:hypothetical protein BCY84_19510 [Trypanosoma cruzi cruzi]|nr:hypothetical protein BCY84_19510 [Trypanosoma cruzi cruzi]